MMWVELNAPDQTVSSSVYYLVASSQWRVQRAEVLWVF